MNTKQRQIGFTLLELLVVLMIIALMAGYVGPKIFKYVEDAKATTAKQQLKTLAKALGSYRLDTGSFPSEADDLEALIKQPSDVENWRGPYLEKEVPKDPWGEPYHLRNPGVNYEVEVYSLGKDKKEGGDNNDADLIEGL